MIQGIPKKLKSDASTDEKNRHWMRTTFDDCMDVVCPTLYTLHMG